LQGPEKLEQNSNNEHLVGAFQREFFVASFFGELRRELLQQVLRPYQQKTHSAPNPEEIRRVMMENFYKVSDDIMKSLKDKESRSDLWNLKGHQSWKYLI